MAVVPGVMVEDLLEELENQQVVVQVDILVVEVRVVTFNT